MVPLTSSAPNFSFYAIPTFYFLVLLPQLLGVIRVFHAKNGDFDNANPRGSAFQNSIRKTVDKKTVAFYERANAAHNNGWENFTLFATSVICANIAEVDAGTLNTVCGASLVLRAVYVGVYLGVEKRQIAFARTGIWAASVACSLYLLFQSGQVMASGGPGAL